MNLTPEQRKCHSAETAACLRERVQCVKLHVVPAMLQTRPLRRKPSTIYSWISVGKFEVLELCRLGEDLSVRAGVVLAR